MPVPEVPSEWRFTSAIERPDGMRVEVDLVVPASNSSKFTLIERSEAAHLAAVNVMRSSDGGAL